MESIDFCYWPQGYFEIENPKSGIAKEQVETIKEHLSLVFVKVTNTEHVPEKTNELKNINELKKTNELSRDDICLPHSTRRYC